MTGKRRGTGHKPIDQGQFLTHQVFDELHRQVGIERLNAAAEDK